MDLSISYIIQQVINGIGLGSIYALIAIGYTIVYGILRLINFAHGEVLMIGTYVVFGIYVNLHFPFTAAIITSVIVAILVGLVIERTAYRPLRGTLEETTLITSFAVSILIQNLGMMLFTPQAKAFSVPSFMKQILNVGGVQFSSMTIIIIIITGILLFGLTLFIKNTKLGIAMRACSENVNASLLMGVNINSVVRTAFIIGSGLAAIAGIMMAGQYGRIEPMMGFVPGIKAFIAAVIGGIGNIAGAAVGGLILGFSEIMFVAILPPEFSAYKDAFVFVLLIIFLLIKPNGLFGSAEERRV